ncbi:hypothetical protein YWS52_32470 [Chitiniphilus shinanonensis]
MAARGTWFWLLCEPVFHATYLMFMFSVIRVRVIGGIDTVVWVMVGLLAFLMFRRTGTQIMNALGANQALFAYRQVRPIDTLLVRGALEGFLMIIVSGVLSLGVALSGHGVVPIDPLRILKALLGLWLLGVGFGCVASVAIALVPELGRIIKLTMMPLFFVSGVMFPLAIVPQPYLAWMLLNPIAHGLEAARSGVAPYYHAVPGLNPDYLYGFALVSCFLGLLLHRRFETRLVAQ